MNESHCENVVLYELIERKISTLTMRQKFSEAQLLIHNCARRNAKLEPQRRIQKGIKSFVHICAIKHPKKEDIRLRSIDISKNATTYAGLGFAQFQKHPTFFVWWPGSRRFYNKSLVGKKPYHPNLRATEEQNSIYANGKIIEIKCVTRNDLTPAQNSKKWFSLSIDSLGDTSNSCFKAHPKKRILGNKWKANLVVRDTILRMIVASPGVCCEA